MTTIVSVDNRNFEEEVLKSSLPVLVFFWADWNGPSKVLLPKLDKIAEDYGDRLKVATLAIHEGPTTATIFRTYNVRTVPVYIVFKGGQVAGMIARPATEDELIQLIGL